MKFAIPVFALLVLVVAAACGGDDDSSSTPSDGGGPPGFNDHGTEDVTGKDALDVEADSFYFQPTFLRGEPGQQLTLTIDNESDTLHNLSVEGQSIDEDIPSDGKVEVQVTFPESGVLTFFCKYHRGQGMAGQLLAGDAQPQAAAGSSNSDQSAASTDNYPGY